MAAVDLAAIPAPLEGLRLLISSKVSAARWTAAGAENLRGGAMMLYLVIAKDAPDEEAPARRQKVRPTHIADLTSLVDAGTVRLAGAILNEEGVPAGSAVLVEADSESAVRDVLARDIYSREGVWSSFEIYPFKQAF